MKKKESVSTVVKKAKKKGIAKKHPNKKESKKPYNAQGR
jgi:hypothetical protein